MSSVEVLDDSVQLINTDDDKAVLTDDEEDEKLGEEEDEENGSDSGDSWIVVEEDLEKASEAEISTEETTDMSGCVDTSSNEDVIEQDKEVDEMEIVDELPIQYPQIQKGLNYSHKPNRELNVFLTASLVFGLAVALGFGYGHFLGWSERLEAMDVNHTEPLQSSLDDEDILMIERLKSENEELRASIDEATVLRNQIQNLMHQNANLEREIEKLRLNHELITENLASQKSIDELRSMLDQTNSLLRETKENLNDITSENEILKIEVGKARYGKPAIPIEEKEKIDKLMAENEELKEEVRKIRFNIPPVSPDSPGDDYRDLPLPNTPCQSESQEEFSSDSRSHTPDSIIKLFNDLVIDSTEKTRNILCKAKLKFTSELKPAFKVFGINVYTKWNEFKDFAQSSSVDEKLKATKNVVNKVGNSLYSFIEDLKIFGQDLMADDFEIFKTNDEQEVDQGTDQQGEDIRNNKVDEDHSWYFRRGKERGFVQNSENDEFLDKKVAKDENNWLFQRASSRKKSREDIDFHDRQFEKKFKNNKKYHSKQKSNNNMRMKRYRGD